MKFIKVIAVFLILLNTTVHGQQQAVGPTAGGPGSWKLLGTVQAKHTADHDAIYVVGPYDWFRKINSKVTNAPLNMQRMIVRYDDGGC